MKHEINMVLQDGTQLLFSKENRLVVKNKYINYDVDFGDCFFCYGDEESIEYTFKEFIAGKLNKITVIGTTDPYLTFILMPNGVKGEREMGSSDILEEDGFCMKIELDLCANGAFGGSFWCYCLNEDETKEFINQWLGLE